MPASNPTADQSQQPAAAPRPHLTDLSRLPLRDRDGRLLMVVESPSGSRLKLRYDARLGVFAIARPPMLSLAYPIDWGFLPSTRGADAAAIACLMLPDAPTHPGVVVPCRALGVATYETEDGERAALKRVLAAPVESPRWAGLTDARKLPAADRDAIEGFLACALLVEDKGLRFAGWDGPKAAERLIREASAG